MTENDFDKLKDAICELVNLAEDATSREVFEMLDNAGADVIDCLDKLSGFEAIGTIEDFKALKEKEEIFDRNIEFFNKINLEVRNKAIDEFAEVVGINIIDIFVSDSERNMAYGILKTTAENLKGERNE